MHFWKPLLQRAYSVATQSNDPSTQNGAIVVRIDENVLARYKSLAIEYPEILELMYEVIAEDHNHFPVGLMETPRRWNDRALKYKYVQHAERNALAAARKKLDAPQLTGLTLICPWAACTECAKTIIESGITRLVIHKEAHDRTHPDSVWKEDIVIAHSMLREAGIEMVEFSGHIDAPPVRHSGTLWTP